MMNRIDYLNQTLGKENDMANVARSKELMAINNAKEAIND